ncbi:MAG: efflux RND transporter permease subunit [Candidatus Scalindua sp. AMX11]|nr:MAG: AcrB/AcrD/AcrF family protein [Candidatus Scalindua sp.]NOG82858.1 efflux RND transporter permease subunit [Planctomycetota bacterium]RZV86202.1 MAG: efflux RND transporter permease subunit [Candidatus Scalindua sp. SCAELEC01]TDE65823.1 MAG: efflux RND transporter permease subunit [Candidatus Scalindua sp. AMX11]GJQ58329.1 MAG: acriflavin resistance protein [Candidatus Scalindua sp.]
MIHAAIHHSRTVLSILILLLIVGTYAYIDIAKESSPDIDIPQIYISMSLEGISPDDSERLLLRPMEQELATIEGVKEMRSTAYQGGGFVLLEFQAGFDKDIAMDDVQKAVDQGRPELPDDIEEPSVTEVNFSLFPVLVVTLSGNLSERTLLKLAQNLQDRIEAISSVLDVNIAGDREELVEILVNPELLESYALNGNDILNLFTASNRLVAAGNLDTGAGRFAIKVPGLFETVHDVMNMPLRVNEDSVIKVRDIAEIRRTFKDPDSIARLHGERAIAIEVVKRSGENIIETVQAVRKVVAEESAFWPQGVEVSFTQDGSETIKIMLLDLQNNVISAIILVMIVVVFALGVRTATLVGIAIPGAFLTGIFVIYAMGLTVNIVVLFSLTLSIGMLVDGAIVVTEYADRRLSEGIPRNKAYAEAARRMTWPIISSTATTLAAFAPLLFWPDTVGEFMKYMPITLIAVLASSMLMALVFVPTLGALYGKPGAASNPKMMRMLTASEEGNLNTITGFTGWYLSVLEVALKRPGKVLLIALALLVSVQFAYMKFGKGVEFFPSIEPDFASVLIHARGNLSIYEQDKLVKEVEDLILEVDGIATMYSRIGTSKQKGTDLPEDSIGQIQIEFTDWHTRKPASKILDEMRERTSGLAGIYVETREQEDGPAAGKAVEILISSRFQEKLEPATVQVLGILEELGDFRDIEDTRPLPGIEWELEVDRAQAAKFGMDITTIGYYIRMITNGLKVAAYRPDDSDDEIDIVLRHDTGQRTLDQLDRVRIETTGGSVPISSFVNRTAQPAVGVIYRSDQRRIVTIKADLPPEININAKVEQIKGWLNNNLDKLDPEVEITFKGQDEDQRNSQSFLTKAFIVALFMMAIILVTQFNSFYSAFLILSAVIMSTIGVMIGLMVTGQPFGIVMTGVGVIALAGIIVNNNIVLIDTFDHLRRQYGDSMDIHEIILRTGAQRLRPVMLTTITTVIGLMPMVLQMNIDFISRKTSFGSPSTQWWVQLSTAIVFGLSFSTVLTLVVTPAALMWRETTAPVISNLKKCLWRFRAKEHSSIVI